MYHLFTVIFLGLTNLSGIATTGVEISAMMLSMDPEMQQSKSQRKTPEKEKIIRYNIPKISKLVRCKRTHIT